MTFVRSAPEPVLPPPPRGRDPAASSTFGSAANIVTTLVIAFFAERSLPHFLAWAFTNGVWRGDAADCRDAGACWIFLHEKAPFILFGIYPEAERWRPLLVVSVLIGLTLWTMPHRHWTRATLLTWVVGIAGSLLAMAGGVAGLTPVPPSAWGGLPVTLLLTVLSLALGFPLGLGLALARRSRLPLGRWLATGTVEILRGVPVLTLLFIAAVMAPLLLPDGMRVETFVRALVVFTLVSAAYLSEVLRGGLQGVPRAQMESAQALGLRRREVLLIVVLPQAIRKVLPPLASTIIVVIKNTSLVMVVGLFDLVSAGRVVLNDPAWPMPYAETYLMIALVYFAVCHGVARYALHQERVLGEGGR
ncbi:amino acid ABC transporter permease [Novosphingobium sp. AP12]|uniref:amino acid ABC transporter permease n=1 Tax=Novosphingobium sp. AP12 TaxID=1144305 RepID=UPI0002721A05|nr:amino acid ABC transporter permease [Novosphingobium sp. AP12]EJL27983.1 amine acid ABC transporter, permease protein, 3-TM region, His/Glu/Gln/Arg/opine family [Novosphingobium sp. AP12]